MFALPLQKDTDLVAVPLNAKLKLQRAKNMDQLGNFIEYLRFLEKAQRLLAEARDRLQIVDIKLSDKDKKDAKNGHANPLHCMNLIPGLENGYVLRKSLSCDSSRYLHQQQQGGHQQQHHGHHHGHGHHAGSGGGPHHDLSPILDEYNDIDQIYDYVRGLAPLPKNLNRFESPAASHEHHNSGSSNHHHNHHHQHHQSQHQHQQHHSHQHSQHQQQQMASQQTLASTTTNGTASTSIHKSPSTDMAKSQPDSGNYSLIRTSNSAHHIGSSSNLINNNNNNSLNSSSGNHSSGHHPGATYTNNNYHHHHHYQQQHHHHDDRPVPPPIETIPGKKLPEKRQRPTLPKLYVKNSSVSGGSGAVIGSGHQKITGAQNIIIGSSHSPAAATTASYVINAKDGLEPQSPLFHIRYVYSY